MSVGPVQVLGSFKRSASHGLDNLFPYANFATAATGQTTDSPRTSLGPSGQISPLVYANKVTYTGQFDHYLFFQPAEAGSIPVAVKRVGWQFSIQAINSGVSSAPGTLVSSNCTASVTANNVPVTGNPQSEGSNRGFKRIKRSEAIPRQLVLTQPDPSS